MIHKQVNIPLTIIENRIETAGHRSILFERPQEFDYDSGDWIDITFPNQNFNGGKTYSLSSSPTESYLMITFKDGISDMKHALAELKVGDSVIIEQYGNDYKFTLKPHKPGILIAGGVGVAPFRSMLKEAVDTGLRSKLKLIYQNKNDSLLFIKELEAWSTTKPNISITKVITNDLNKKQKIKLVTNAVIDVNGTYYIAGPEDMVENTEHLLIDLGVSVKDIKIDSFGSY